MIIQPILRKCNWCGLEAHNKEELNLFTVCKRYEYGHRNICKACFSKALRKGGKYSKQHTVASARWYAENGIKRKKRITFKIGGHDFERMYVEGKPRTGVCSECGAVGKTHLHHDLYDPENPLKYTRELCMSCHTKFHNDKRRKALDEL